MSRFGLNFFCGGAAQTVVQVKRGFDYWCATMASGILPEWQREWVLGVLHSHAERRCYGDPVLRTSADDSKHARNAHYFYTTLAMRFGRASGHSTSRGRSRPAR